jgi:excinuclease ABC subunit C
MIRRIFPFSDHKIGIRPCLYSQIGLCDPCPNLIEKNENQLAKSKERKIYLKNIRNLNSLLDGNIEKVRRSLDKEMKIQSKSQNFEEAAIIRDKIKKLEYITSPKISVDSYLENPNFYEDIRQKELSEFKKLLSKSNLQISKLARIECFDVAHLQGSSATASMVTFIEGTAEKSLYRNFRIRQKRGQDDYESMREVAGRRKNNLGKWGRPDLIIVDGGPGQLSIFLKEFEEDKIPVIGLAKRLETLVIPGVFLGTSDMRNVRLPMGNVLNLVQRIRNEAHRFAQAYHHKLFARSLFEKDK